MPTAGPSDECVENAVAAIKEVQSNCRTRLMQIDERVELPDAPLGWISDVDLHLLVKDVLQSSGLLHVNLRKQVEDAKRVGVLTAALRSLIALLERFGDDSQALEQARRALVVEGSTPPNDETNPTRHCGGSVVHGPHEWDDGGGAGDSLFHCPGEGSTPTPADGKCRRSHDDDDVSVARVC